MRFTKFLIIPMSLSLLSGCNLLPSKNHNLELLKFEVVHDSEPTKSLHYRHLFNLDEASEKDTVNVIDEDEKLSLKAIVKNENRDSFVDLVLFSSQLNTYIVFNEGNGEYQCSSTTVFEDGLWVTSILLDFNPGDINGYLEVTEISFLKNGSDKSNAFISESSIKKVSYHKHSYGEWEIAKQPEAYADGSKERKCISCDHVDIAVVDALDIQNENDFFYFVNDDCCWIDGRVNPNTGTVCIPRFHQGLPVTELWSLYCSKDPNFREVYISKNIKSIGLNPTDGPMPEGAVRNVFCWSTTLERIIVDPENQFYSSENGALYTKDKSKLLYDPQNRT